MSARNDAVRQVLGWAASSRSGQTCTPKGGQPPAAPPEATHLPRPSRQPLGVSNRGSAEHPHSKKSQLGPYRSTNFTAAGGARLCELSGGSLGKRKEAWQGEPMEPKNESALLRGWGLPHAMFVVGSSSSPSSS